MKSTLFEPPIGLRNTHIQTIFSSVGPRRVRVRKAFSGHRKNQQLMVLKTQTGTRLAGYFNQSNSQRSRQLVILIHGWEGSHESSYMLSMTTSLLNAGIDVFRLNMRDHGDSHHLNRDVFNSTMLDDVVDGIENLQSRLNYSDYVLAGFSLGGNFSCRAASSKFKDKIRLSLVAAFCPVLHAGISNEVLSEPRNSLYSQYFIAKWKRSLRKKLEYYPDYGYATQLDQLKSLEQMNDVLIPEYTPFSNVDDYFAAYALTGETMATTHCPVYMHFSKDDMIIPHQNVSELADNQQVHVSLSDYGGHCGFLNNWRFDSWQDQRVLELIGNQLS